MGKRKAKGKAAPATQASVLGGLADALETVHGKLGDATQALSLQDGEYDQLAAVANLTLDSLRSQRDAIGVIANRVRALAAEVQS